MYKQIDKHLFTILYIYYYIYFIKIMYMLFCSDQQFFIMSKNIRTPYFPFIRKFLRETREHICIGAGSRNLLEQASFYIDPRNWLLQKVIANLHKFLHVLHGRIIGWTCRTCECIILIPTLSAKYFNYQNNKNDILRATNSVESLSLSLYQA